MAKQQPAVVIIVRHGARLDAADKGWHLTSPTPYDPPLTYGGWVQSRALGLRIASLLNKRGTEATTDGTVSPPKVSLADSGLEIHGLNTSYSNGDKNGTTRTKRRKQKVIIHSSPFQRCVQTSVGISAGLSQYQNVSANGRKGSDTRIKTVTHLHSASPRLQATKAVGSPKLEPVVEPRHPKSREDVRHSLREHTKQEKATLRVDAFLGEWLSPDYFEMITPPPESTLMVAGAKADLLRQVDSIDTYAPTGTPKLPGSLWGTHAASSQPHSMSNGSDGPTDNVKTDQRAVPKRDRASSHSSTGSSSSHKSDGLSSPFKPAEMMPPSTSKQSDSFGYTPPVPTYAISPVDSIPRGYIAHAREACVDIDYQWDSMREPHLWGDGGTFGEEWSSMHKRFRRGLESMLEWYGENHGNQHTDDHEAVPGVSPNGEEEEDEETELVLVLVTHGAGCNALIGAMTNQPVLLDVGMASLTMATRKPDAPSLLGTTASPTRVPVPVTTDSDPRPHPPHRRSSVDLGLSSVYDMKIVASSEHLRPGVDPSNTSAPAPLSPFLSSQNAPDYRRRYGSGSHAAAGAPIASSWDLGEPAHQPPPRPNHPALGSMRRPSQATGIQPIRPYSISTAPPPQPRPISANIDGSSAASGLWSPMGGKPDSPSNLTSDVPYSLDGATKSTDDIASPKQTDGASTPEEVAEKLAEEAEKDEAVSDLPIVSSEIPKGLGRSLSQRGLWGSAPSGARNERVQGITKRRWTLQQER